ncbi:MAG: AraC family transcriptional regulator [Paenibacillaceae bacterium]|nr:AraC family transcriptional regulator [Paenibacillaceae bacterium]
MWNPSIFSKSNLVLNRHLTRLKGESATFYVHYWGAKSRHKGNTPHSHSFFEICYVLHGEGTYVHDGVTYPLEAGTLYCSKPGGRHHIRSELGMQLLFVALEPVQGSCSPAFNREFAKLCLHPHLFLTHAELSPPVLLWQTLLLQAADYDKWDKESVGLVAYSLLVSCVSYFHQYSLSGGGTEQEELSPDRKATFQQMMEYIHAHLQEKMKLQDVAKSVHLSERQLSRLLAEELGQSFPSAVRTERMKRAAYLLGCTDVPLKQIAEDTGFENVQYFTQVFTREMGIPPNHFRKECLSHESVDRHIHHYLRQVATRHQKK